MNMQPHHVILCQIENFLVNVQWSVYSMKVRFDLTDDYFKLKRLFSTGSSCRQKNPMYAGKFSNSIYLVQPDIYAVIHTGEQF